MKRLLLESILYYSDFFEFNLEELWLEYYKQFIIDFFKSKDKEDDPKYYIEKYIKDKDEDFRSYFDSKFNKYLENKIENFIKEDLKCFFYNYNDNQFGDKHEISDDLIYKLFKNEDAVVNINKLFKYEFLTKEKIIEYYKLAYK